MAIDVKAELKYYQISSQKLRLVIDLVRGKMVGEALTILRFVNKKGAKPVSKLISSAMANGENNFGIPAENLFVYKIVVDEAPTRKWRRYGARGRFKPILRRASHINVVLREKE
ncbi:MAG: 50S ribosomal protein L22 [Anaerolineaceae bacterium]|nr:50S ribosomal protein L22 [Anaerolineaceae bacterium]